LGRHFFRPAHLHLKVFGAGYEDLTSQLYFPGGKFVEDDVANAVRDGLLLSVNYDENPVRARYDFVLVPDAATVAEDVRQGA
jgi:catechol 1,2-dioxygenase